MTPETEQWKLNGDCDKCRRAKYCTKVCSVHTKTTQRLMRGAIETIVNRSIPEPFASDMKKYL